MNEIMHSPVEQQQIMPVPAHEAWTPADDAMFREYAAGSAAVHTEVQANELAETEALARQQAEEIARNQQHRITSGTTVGFAKVTGRGNQLTQMSDEDRTNYIRTQQTMFALDQQMKHAQLVHEQEDGDESND